MKLAETVTLGGSGLDRAAHLRGVDAQAKILQRQDLKVTLFWRGQPLISGPETGEVSLAWVNVDHSLLDHRSEDFVFLGLDDDGAPMVAADISSWKPDVLAEQVDGFVNMTEQSDASLASDYRFMDLKAILTRVDARNGELMATARGIFEWHRIHQFCANCGDQTQMAQAGWQRNCAACGRSHFPRTDPVVIMLITHGNSVLMGRSPGWPDGMYSLLAGFVEPGETLEGAVRREVFEESGVRVGEVGYLASQPWPFPASLMFGCYGRATSQEINIDPVEIEHALWVTREEMLDVFEGIHTSINPPRRGAIAQFLLQMWLADSLD